MDKRVIEMVIFQTKNEESEEHFIKLFYTLNEVLERDVAGFIKRSLTKDHAQDKWVEMIWWNSIEAAHTALIALPQTSEFQQYCSVIAEGSTTMFHLEGKA